MKNNNFEILYYLLGGLACGIIYSLLIFRMTSSMLVKPIIYLYPTEETKVEVKLGYPDNLTVSYPVYNNSWDVIASPNGDLKEINTNKELYSLYYESDTDNGYKIEKDGFIVQKEDIVPFLEEKLEILGLNYKEKEEFIVYWLPILQKNNYNYIRFATYDEMNERMPLEINPKPDTLIRVMMTYKGLNNKIDIEEQYLKKVERNGFAAVEWGGSEIK